MKKKTLTVIFLLGLFSMGYAQTADTTKTTKKSSKVEETTTPSSVDLKSTLSGGFYLRAGLVFPSSGYLGGNSLGNTGYNLQLGNQFAIGPVVADHFRLGLDMSWLDASYVTLKDVVVYSNVGYSSSLSNGKSAIISMLGVGPYVSYAPMEKLAFSTRFKVMPTFAVSVQDQSTTILTETATTTVAGGGFGVCYLWGLEARYSIFNLGFDLEFGKPKFKKIGGDLDFSDYSAKINNARLYIGLRF